MRTPMKAIRAKCLDCSGGSTKEAQHCLVESCPLFPYRFGMRPETAQKLGKEGDAAAAES